MIHALSRIRALSIMALALAACGELGPSEELASSAESVVSIEAQPPPVVITVSVTVTPGCQPTGSIDWCIPETGLVTGTVTEVLLPGGDPATNGTLVLQVCATGADGFAVWQPKERCDAGHGARWIGSGSWDLAAIVGPPTFTVYPNENSGWRFAYIPVPGSGLKRATSLAFNLNRTCTCP